MTDVVVIGAGLAGLTAATRLAQAGRTTLLISFGVGGLHLSPGVVDVLGYAPTLVTRPLEAVADVAPDHPYRQLGADRVAAALGWLRQTVGDDWFVGDIAHNVLLPTAVGAFRPTALAPQTMAAGAVRDGMRYVIVGLRALKDFHAGLVAANLARTVVPGGGAVTARSITLTANPRPGEADVSPVAFARAMDDGRFATTLAAELAPLVRDGETVGMPAVLGRRDASAVWSALQEQIGAPLFEIPTPPPSLAGMRLGDRLTSALNAAGGRIVMGSQVTGVTHHGGRITAVTADTAGRERHYETRSVVLAAGGFESGALAVDSSGAVRERVRDLPLVGLPADGSPPFAPDYWAEHPLFRAGVAVDPTMRPVGPDGAPVYENLYAVGGLLAGAVRWREKSGEGIALASALAAADSIIEGDL